MTSAPRTMIQVGKYREAIRFRRKDGIICGRRPLRHIFTIGPAV